jgi:hypothetical protein
MARARDRNLGPPLECNLRLLLGSYAEDALQLMVHLAKPVGGWGGQSIQERYGRGHILAGPSKSQMWHTFMVDGSSNGFGLSLGFGEVDGGGSLRPQCGLPSV